MNKEWQLAQNSDREKRLADKNAELKLSPVISGTCKGSLIFTIPFRTFGRVTVALPFGSLVVCLVTAVIFQFEEINKTMCNVTNYAPSVSAITGITPQRYFWRICIALHSAPRISIGFIYWYYYLERASLVESSKQRMYQIIISLTFYTYMLENASLIGITYIANVENYYLHEKLFIVFMVASLVYQLVTIIAFRFAHPDMNIVPHIAWSYNLKRLFFGLILAFTVGMLYFFYRHRMHCDSLAFTKFSCCEYIIVVLNIAYHYTAVYDFGKRAWQFVLDGWQSIDANDNLKAR